MATVAKIIPAAIEAFSDSVMLPLALGIVMGCVMNGKTLGLIPCDSLPMTMMPSAQGPSFLKMFSTKSGRVEVAIDAPRLAERDVDVERVQSLEFRV